MNDFLQSLRNGQAEKQRTPKTRKNYDNSYHYTSGPRFHSYGGSGYQNTRSPHMKRPPMQQQQGNQLPMDDVSTAALLAEAIETLTNHVETLTKNQDYMISIQERTADMLERQAIAIERIVDYLDLSPLREDHLPEDEEAEEAVQERTFENHYVTSRQPAPEIEEAEEIVEKPARKTRSVIRKRKKVVAKKAESVPADTKGLLSRETVMDIIHTMRSEGATYDQVASRLVELGQPTFSGRGEWHAQTIHRLCSKK